MIGGKGRGTGKSVITKSRWATVEFLKTCIRTRELAVPKLFILPQEAYLNSLSPFEPVTLCLTAPRPFDFTS